VKLKLDESVSSLQDLRGLVMEIREYAKWHAHNDIKKRVHVRTGTKEPDMTASARAVLHEWSGGKELASRSLDELIATLEDYGRKAPTITITLAALPSAGMKKQLVSWCRDNITPNILVDFQFNSTLLGGLVVRSSSHVYDWSFRRQILAERNKFPEVLRRV
jgi:hypothetical protein